MNKITFPLKLRMQGPAVADLQDALQLCMDRGAILGNDEGGRRELSAALKRERVEQIYGDVTTKLVRIFQRERPLEPSGNVDEATAKEINAFLREFGVLDGQNDGWTEVVNVLNEQGRSLSVINLGTDHLASIDEKIGTLGREQERAERRDSERVTQMAFGVDNGEPGAQSYSDEQR